MTDLRARDNRDCCYFLFNYYCLVYQYLLTQSKLILKTQQHLGHCYYEYDCDYNYYGFH